MGEAGGYGNLFVMDRQEAVCSAHTRLQARQAENQQEELSVFKKRKCYGEHMDFFFFFFFFFFWTFSEKYSGLPTIPMTENIC